jgi:ABC-2 type transport system ATP-binding protein
MSTQSGVPPIRCRGLTRYYGRTVGIDGLDLDVAPGAVTGFLGPNGAGKTTVIRLLTGLLKPTQGTAELFGVAAQQPHARATTGYMPADPAFYRHLSGTQNLNLLAELGRWESPDRAWAAELLELNAEALERPVATYSSGMIQKLGLVQAVQHRPALVILDEPANRLDPIAHHRFEEMVQSIAADGRTVFLSSHMLSEVESLCDHVAMVRAGKLLTTADVADLTAAAMREVTIRYHHPHPIPGGLLDATAHGNVVRGKLKGASVDVLRAVLADPEVEDLLVEPASLEDTFLHLYEADR